MNLFTCVSCRWNTSRLVTVATKQKRLHLVVLMCIIGDLGRQNVLRLTTEVRAQQDAETLFSGVENDEGEGGDEEERGSLGGWRVAFPRVAAKQDDASKMKSGLRYVLNPLSHLDTFSFGYSCAFLLYVLSEAQYEKQ